MARAKKTGRIVEREYLDIVNEEYARAKKILNPLLKGVNRSFVKFYWHNPRTKWGGVCWRFSRVISASQNYRDLSHQEKWSKEQFRLMLRHELVHLSGASRHSSGDFLSRLYALGGHRYVGAPQYDGVKSKKK